MESTATRIAEALFLTYWTVLAAELVGDKSLYQVASLASRFSARAVLAGATGAFAVKMLVAVSLGHFLTSIPPRPLSVVSGLAFLATGGLLWRGARPQREPPDPQPGRARGVAAAFSSIVLTEWVDAGTIAAALLTSRSGRPVLVWLAATAAMSTKCVFAVLIGSRLRRYLPGVVAARVAAVTCLLLSAASFFEALRTPGR